MKKALAKGITDIKPRSHSQFGNKTSKFPTIRQTPTKTPMLTLLKMNRIVPVIPNKIFYFYCLLRFSSHILNKEKAPNGQ